MDLGTDAQVLRYLLREGVMTMQADADVIARKVIEVLEKKEYITHSYDDYDLYP